MRGLHLAGFLSLGLFFITPSIACGYDIKTVDFRDLKDRTLTETGQAAFDVYKDAWQHAETAHFVYHFLKPDDAEPYVVHAEAYYQWVKEILRVTDGTSRTKSHLFIFSDHDAWRDFVQTSPERLPGAEAFTNGIELFVYRDPFWMAAPHTLAHEITHLAAARFIEGRLPLFLNEGFAEFMAMKASSMKTGGDPYAVRALKSIPEKDFIPLDKMAALKAYPEDAEIFYLESELFIRFLVQIGEEKLYELLSRSAKGEDPLRACERLYGMDRKELSEKFRMYAQTRGKSRV